jgi:hypothetical protein
MRAIPGAIEMRGLVSTNRYPSLIMLPPGRWSSMLAKTDELHIWLSGSVTKKRLERESGFEPPTFCLGSRHSAAELLPHLESLYHKNSTVGLTKKLTKIKISALDVIQSKVVFQIVVRFSWVRIFFF